MRVKISDVRAVGVTAAACFPDKYAQATRVARVGYSVVPASAGIFSSMVPPEAAMVGP